MAPKPTRTLTAGGSLIGGRPDGSADHVQPRRGVHRGRGTSRVYSGVCRRGDLNPHALAGTSPSSQFLPLLGTVHFACPLHRAAQSGTDPTPFAMSRFNADSTAGHPHATATRRIALRSVGMVPPHIPTNDTWPSLSRGTLGAPDRSRTAPGPGPRTRPRARR